MKDFDWDATWSPEDQEDYLWDVLNLQLQCTDMRGGDDDE